MQVSKSLATFCIKAILILVLWDIAEVDEMQQPQDGTTCSESSGPICSQESQELTRCSSTSDLAEQTHPNSLQGETCTSHILETTF